MIFAGLGIDGIMRMTQRDPAELFKILDHCTDIPSWWDTTNWNKLQPWNAARCA